ncbi:MAG: RNA methyltransferase [Acidobacteriota bacterium]
MMKTATHLTSRENPLLKKIRLLVSGSGRAPEELVVAEGNRVLHEVSQSGRDIEAVVFSESFGRETHERVLLEDWHNRRIRLYCVNQKLFVSLSRLRTPQGAIALVKVPEVPFPPATDQDVLMLYICGIQDPGNMGALIRTAAASGVTLVCTYRTDAMRGVPYTETDLKSPCAILLGNEGSGLIEEKFAGLPAIHIPMMNGIESLNVALAVAVILFEACRQRCRQ